MAQMPSRASSRIALEVCHSRRLEHHAMSLSLLTALWRSSTMVPSSKWNIRARSCSMTPDHVSQNRKFSKSKSNLATRSQQSSSSRRWATSHQAMSMQTLSSNSNSCPMTATAGRATTWSFLKESRSNKSLNAYHALLEHSMVDLWPLRATSRSLRKLANLLRMRACPWRAQTKEATCTWRLKFSSPRSSNWRRSSGSLQLCRLMKSWTRIEIDRSIACSAWYHTLNRH